ncbi:hypothetical protein BH762_gp114 [Gordonia phage OneUp]|uniref:Uncharacterized protein n=1 Tax=Gordonia phage OneUp TaxID=1838074 RepID=A0A160DEV4_9CAUD|nr:hypothetical protein BH762_gp114 [Gordonia phage OneUp]ANA86405.1 hypothetical protein PBI_ONEUP_70 [Gordonia phage OneUp]
MDDDFQPIAAATQFEVGKKYRIRLGDDGPISTAFCTGRTDDTITFVPAREGGDNYSIIHAYGFDAARFLFNEEESNEH